MGLNRQRAIITCECGRKMPVTPTESPWEFEWWCSCGRARA